MLSFKLHQVAVEFLDNVDKAQPFLKPLSIIVGHAVNAQAYIVQLSEGGQNIVTSSQTLHSHYAQLASVLSQHVNLQKFFASLEFTKSMLNSANTCLRGNDIAITALQKKIDDVGEKFGIYMVNQTPRNAVELMRIAEDTLQSFESFSNFLSLIKDNLENQEILPEHNSEISLIIPSVIGFKEFIDKLQAFYQAYDELCQILNISLHDFPLTLVKIESGSLWIKAFGESRVITMILEFITALVRYIHRNFTKEGKIESIPRKVESIEEIIKLRKQLERMGIDCSDIDDNIKKCTLTLSGSLSQLLDGQPSIVLNGKTYSVGNELNQASISNQSQMRLIEDSSNISGKE